jgi:hypothetical protein
MHIMNQAICTSKSHRLSQLRGHFRLLIPDRFEVLPLPEMVVPSPQFPHFTDAL